LESISTPTQITREQLLNLSSQELDDYVVDIQKNRNLTPEEEKQLKKQRRLIKNRESAQLSRLRKKMYVEELEKKIKDLEDDKKRLEEKVTELTEIINNGNMSNNTFNNNSNTVNSNGSSSNNNAARKLGVFFLDFVFVWNIFENTKQRRRCWNEIFAISRRIQSFTRIGESGSRNCEFAKSCRCCSTSKSRELILRNGT